MSASTVIALASLGLAALTVVVSYLNVRRQAKAAMEVDRSKWLREKQDEVYGRLVEVLFVDSWIPRPASDDPRWVDLKNVMQAALRYASDAVLADAQQIQRDIESRQDSGILTRTQAQARTNLLREIRTELVGEREAEKTWRRYDRANIE